MPKMLLKVVPERGNSANNTLIEMFFQTTEDEDNRGWAALKDFAADILEWGELEDTPNSVLNEGWRNVCEVLGITV